MPLRRATLIRRPAVLLLTGGMVVALAGCARPATDSGATTPSGSVPASGSTASPGTGSSPTSGPGAPGTSGPTVSAQATVDRTAIPPAGPAWRASPGSRAVQTATLPGGTVSLMWMDPSRLRFRVVPGYAVPEGSPATKADTRPSTWVPTMLAGFDSGYKLSDHVGGYYYLGRTVAPLRTGLASLVTHADGSLTVGVWGGDVRMNPDTVMVRQNLRPLVSDGVARAKATDGPRVWGIANGNRARVNRSALGRLPDGSLVFVYAHDATAADLAGTLVRLGVVEAVDLDMNVSWPTGFVYSHVGGRTTGTKINPHVVRPPSTYLSRFKKDFVVVSAR